MKTNKKQILGWIAVCITIAISSLWAYWGSIENFHEGWYSTSFFENLFMLVFQYSSVTIIFIVLAQIALQWKLIGLILHVVLAGFSVWFFSGANFFVVGLMIVIPILVLGALYYFGAPKPIILAKALVAGIPLLIFLAISIPLGIKVSNRLNDNNDGMRIVEGNGVTLIWAPRGPGWPDQGMTWVEAQERCRYLSEDGTTIMEEVQNIWRLPTVEEAVCSMMLHGENAGGVWNAEDQIAVYEKTPDKESPLWDVYSQVIYYWTSQTYPNDEQRAYIIVYHGGVHSKMKIDGQSYLSFRAVKDVPSNEG